MLDELFAAIEQHDLKHLLSLLEGGVDINGRHPRQHSWSPLMVAIDEVAEGGHVEAVILLLRYGASIEGVGDASGITPLIVAVQLNEPETTHLLLASGADPNTRTNEGDSPLRLAVEHGNLALASLLLYCGATRTINDFGGLSYMTALGRSASMLNIPMIELLLQSGADKTQLDGIYRPAFCRMPQREASNEIAWDAAMKLLALPSATQSDSNSV